MCIRIVEEDQCQLLCVTEWFVTQDLLKIWHDSDGYCDDHEFVNWLNGYKQFKAQKPQIKESIPIAGHLARVKDWCLADNEKNMLTRTVEKVFMHARQVSDICLCLSDMITPKN